MNTRLNSSSKPMLKAIIVDDEPGAIRLLASYLRHYSTIELIGTFRNGLKAFAFLQEHPADIVFLDINMPLLTGISLSRMLQADTQVIFTTAYSEYAVESYEVSATDYLLKPISMERFASAMAKVLQKNDFSGDTEQVITVKSGAKTHRVALSEILYLEKDGNYLTYYLKNSRIVARETIDEALSRLPGNFIQTHKSYIVNTHCISSFTKTQLSIQKVEIPVGKSFKEAVFHVLKTSP